MCCVIQRIRVASSLGYNLLTIPWLHTMDDMNYLVAFSVLVICWSPSSVVDLNSPIVCLSFLYECYVDVAMILRY
jgi:hypothetical protein